MNCFKIKPVKSNSGDIHLISSNADRFSVLILAIIFQCLTLVFAAKGFQLIFDGNPVGFFMIAFFSIPGSAIIWFNYFEKTGKNCNILINQAKSRIEIDPPGVFKTTVIKIDEQGVNFIPFQDIEAIRVLTAVKDHCVLQFHIKNNQEIFGPFRISYPETGHIVSRIAGLIGCGVNISPANIPLSPPPVESVRDNDPEYPEASGFDFFHNYPALLFLCFVLICAVVKYLDTRPPIWFYLGVHFQAVVAATGIIFFIKGRELMKTTWNKTGYIFFCLISCFLFLSFYLPSRGLFPLLAGCIILLIPVILRMEFKFTGRIKQLLLFILVISIAGPLLWYGYSASKTIYSFFSLNHRDIEGIAFYKIDASRKVDKKPAAIVGESAIIHKIMEMLKSSVSQKDPRRVQRHYMIRIKRHDGVSLFASIGMMNQNEGCILFLSKFGVWGWEFGGYDNPLLVEGLKNNLNLWPDID